MKLFGWRWPKRPTMLRAGAVLAAAAAIWLGAATASAYNNLDNPPPCPWSYSGGYSVLTIYFNNSSGSFTPTGDYASAYAAARASWYNTNTPAAFSYSASGGSTQKMDYLGTLGPFGTTTVTCNGSGFRTSTVVTLNRSLLDAGSYSGIFWKQFTAAHELGHDIGMSHSNVLPAIMQPSMPPTSFASTAWPNGGYNGPVSDDECGVNHVYSSTGWPPTCGY